ncbi:MAG: hypothetical protein IT210_26000 [Armatimonadetes bacterium]|nr:hypothetical protein [Armatimonadota bacterium]
MQVYRSTITLRSASASAWQADTVFGHLCWSLARREGDDALTAFLKRYQEGSPPVLVSDGFPAGFLPRPRSGGASDSRSHERLPKSERIASYRKEKDRIKARWLTPEEFDRARRGEAATPQDRISIPERSVSKNQINRLTGATGGGELFDFTEYCLKAVDIYWKVAEGDEARINDFLEELRQSGYGKRKSVGYGELAGRPTFDPFEGFANFEGANGFVSLSNFVPASTDPAEGFWNTAVKYGKLGEEYALPKPFKKPLIQLTAGSCFYDAPPRAWCGRMVERLTPDDRIVQYGYGFPVPMALPERR